VAENIQFHIWNRAVSFLLSSLQCNVQLSYGACQTSNNGFDVVVKIGFINEHIQPYGVCIEFLKKLLQVSLEEMNYDERLQKKLE
jgi:hypothetical protein